MSNTNTKKCIFCKRSLTDEKIPVCHRCAQKGQNGFLTVATVIGTGLTYFIKKKK